MKSFLMAASKRKDPNFMQVSGYIPKDLALRFKAACMISEIEISKAMEQMMIKWLEEQAGDPTKQTK